VVGRDDRRESEMKAQEESQKKLEDLMRKLKKKKAKILKLTGDLNAANR